MKSELGGWHMFNMLWPLFSGLGGILGVTVGWFVLNFLGKPFLEFLTLRKEIQEDLIYLSNVYPPSQQTFHEGTEEDYQNEVTKFRDARDKMRQLGSRMISFSTFLTKPLPYILQRWMGYDLDVAARNLLGLSTEFETIDITIRRYRIEVALRLPHSEEKMARLLIAQRTRGREAAASPRRKSDADQSS